jgi:ABC-type transport system involved in multi-copper enzyme maturation permease subunit
MKNGPTLPAIVWAELRKLLSRPVARVALLVLVAVALLGPLALRFAAESAVSVNGQDMGATLDRSVANGLRWGLVVRGFFAAQFLIAMLGSVSLAGELQARTLRDDLVRSVARWQVLLAKWLALCGWSAASLLAHGVVASVVGLLALPATGETQLQHVALGAGGMWLAECSFAAVTLAVASLTRSVPGTLVALVLFLVFERFGTWAAWGLRSLMSLGGNEPPAAFAVLQFAPSAAWSGWSELLGGATPTWQPWVALLGWTALAALVAWRRFERMDVL